jgi:hypothetical protein
MNSFRFVVVAFSACCSVVSSLGAPPDVAEPIIFPIVLGGKCGYIDIQGSVIVTPQFYKCRPMSDGLAAFLLDNSKRSLWGYLDARGKVLIPPSFAWTGDFNEGVAAVQTHGRTVLDDRIAFIDHSGKVLFEKEPLRIPGTWQSGGPVELRLSEGLIAFPDPVTGKFGYVNASGRFDIVPQFDTAYPFRDGLARVQSGSRFGYIDHKGAYVIEPIFKTSTDFQEGFAAALQESRGQRVVGFIDKTGQFRICSPLDPSHVYDIMKRDYDAEVERFNSFSKSDTFPWILLLQDDGIPASPSRFVDGLAVVRNVPVDSSQCCTYAFLDRNGKRGVTGNFATAEPFSEGLAVTDKGYINKAGIVVIPISRVGSGPLRLHEFKHGLARVDFTASWFPNSSDPWGYINLLGSLVWESH